MFIQTEATPNPATLKFIPGKPVLPGSTREYRAAEEADDCALAQQLFTVSGVSGVFLGQDFITVSKSDGEWQHLKPAILGHIMDHYLSSAPMLKAKSPGHDRQRRVFDESDKAIVGTIKELAGNPRPASRGAGWRRHHLSWLQGRRGLSQHEGRARLPSSTATLKHGSRNLLRHFVPEVTEVRPV